MLNTSEMRVVLLERKKFFEERVNRIAERTESKELNCTEGLMKIAARRAEYKGMLSYAESIGVITSEEYNYLYDESNRWADVIWNMSNVHK